MNVRLFSVRSSLLASEPVPAYTPAEFDFVNIALIDWKKLADRRTTGTIDKTKSAFRQHWAYVEKAAAGAALKTGSFAEEDLSQHIFFAEFNEIPPPELACQVFHKARLVDCASEKRDSLPDKIRQFYEMVE
jgi:hypothetical protein